MKDLPTIKQQLQDNIICILDGNTKETISRICQEIIDNLKIIGIYILTKDEKFLGAFSTLEKAQQKYEQWNQHLKPYMKKDFEWIPYGSCGWQLNPDCKLGNIDIKFLSIQ